MPKRPLFTGTWVLQKIRAVEPSPARTLLYKRCGSGSTDSLTRRIRVRTKKFLPDPNLVYYRSCKLSRKSSQFLLRKNIYINQCVRNLDPLLCVASLYKLNISRSGLTACIAKFSFLLLDTPCIS